MSEVLQPAEARAALRRRSYFHGKIISRDGLLSLDCVIRNLSDTGARIQILEHELFPSRFFLLCTVLEKTFETEVVWRRRGFAGLNFHAAHDMAAPLPPRLRVVQRIFAEHCTRSSPGL